MKLPADGASEGAVVKGKVPHRRRQRVHAPERHHLALDPDGFDWKKYGEKTLNDPPRLRSYFRCAESKSHHCPALKFVDFCLPSKFHPPGTFVVYQRQHCHPPLTPTPGDPLPLHKVSLPPQIGFPCLPAVVKWIQEETSKTATAGSARVKRKRQETFPKLPKIHRSKEGMRRQDGAAGAHGSGCTIETSYGSSFNSLESHILPAPPQNIHSFPHSKPPMQQEDDSLLLLHCPSQSSLVSGSPFPVPQSSTENLLVSPIPARDSMGHQETTRQGALFRTNAQETLHTSTAGEEKSLGIPGSCLRQGCRGQEGAHEHQGAPVYPEQSLGLGCCTPPLTTLPSWPHTHRPIFGIPEHQSQQQHQQHQWTASLPPQLAETYSMGYRTSQPSSTQNYSVVESSSFRGVQRGRSPCTHPGVGAGHSYCSGLSSCIDTCTSSQGCVNSGNFDGGQKLETKARPIVAARMACFQGAGEAGTMVNGTTLSAECAEPEWTVDRLCDLLGLTQPGGG